MEYADNNDVVLTTADIKVISTWGDIKRYISYGYRVQDLRDAFSIGRRVEVENIYGLCSVLSRLDVRIFDDE